MSDDVRVATSQQLQDIGRAADIHQYDARLNADLVSRLDPNGYHVLVLTQSRHRDGRDTVRHHRVRALLKLADARHPIDVSLDVSDSHWGNLPSARAALAARRLLQELNR